MRAPTILHAGLLALRLKGSWRGALIRGASGSGKSDLALRAMAEGFRLVADDRTIVFACEGRLFGRAPGALRGLFEARGMGVVAEGCLPMAEIILAVDCVAGPGDRERMADFRGEDVISVRLPVLRFWPLAASAPEMLRRALRHLGGRGQQAYQAPLQPGDPACAHAGGPGV